MSSLSHFKRNIHHEFILPFPIQNLLTVTRNPALLFDIWLLTALKPHPLPPSPPPPPRPDPTSEWADKKGQMLPASNQQAPATSLPSRRPRLLTTAKPQSGSFTHTLKPFQTRWEACPAPPETSVIWVMRLSYPLEDGGGTIRPYTQIKPEGRVPSLQGIHRTLHCLISYL